MFSSFKSYPRNRHFPNLDKQQKLEKGRVGYQHKNGIMFVFHDGTAYDGHQFRKTPELIVANFAWDGNAFPGNEYWAGSLTASGDPAAACCSTIWNHLNPKINKRYMRGENCWVVMNNGSFKKLSEL